MRAAEDPEAEDDGPFDLLLGYHLRRASVVVMADFAAVLAPLGLKPAEASILFKIGERRDLTQSDVGRALGIQRANMTPLIARLMSQGLIEREALDGRAQVLNLSRAGNAVRLRALAATREHEDRLFGSLSKPARARLIRRLRQIWQSHETSHGAN